MRTPMIAALAATLLSLTLPALAADPQVPKLDVTPTCRPLEKGDMMQLDESRCRQIEADARAQLVKEWAKFPAADRTECITTATMGGTASYVELITCLEMKRDVAGLSNNSDDSSMRSKPTELGPKKR